MSSQRVAKDIVLSGIALVVVFSIPFFPLVVTAAGLEVSSISLHSPGTLIRLSYVGAAVATAVTAWRKSNVPLAITFLAMIAGAIAFFILSLQP